MNGARSSFQMTLHSPSMELSNISFHGSWTMTRNFSQNTSRVSHLPPVFYICSEDFKPLGIQAPLFGAVCFVLVYAIPGKTTWLITNWAWTYISIPFPFPLRKGKTKWSYYRSEKAAITLPTLTFFNLYGFPLFGCFYSSGFVVILSYSMMGRTLCARKPPFDCDSVEGSASSQQVSSKIT